VLAFVHVAILFRVCLFAFTVKCRQPFAVAAVVVVVVVALKTVYSLVCQSYKVSPSAVNES